MWFLPETAIFSSIFGHTDPRIGASKAKNCEEVDFDARKPPNPPKLPKNACGGVPFVSVNSFT